MTAPTPDAERVQGEVTAAVERAGDAVLRWMHGEHADLYRPDLDSARDILAAALDGDDAAKAMFDAFRQVKGGDRAWFELPNHTQDSWRDVAKAHRAALLGSAP